MSQYPRRVLSSGYITWPPGASVRTWVRGGSAVDIPPGSALEAAYNVNNLTPVQNAPWPGDEACFDRSALSN